MSSGPHPLLAASVCALLFGPACSEPSSTPAPVPEARVDVEATVDAATVLDSSLVESAVDVSSEEEELLRVLGYVSSEPIHDQSGVAIHDREMIQPGWNLYVTQAGREARLIDMQGETVHVWHDTQLSERERTLGVRHRFPPWWRTVHLFPNGDLLAQTDYGSIARLDWDSKLVWLHRARTHHDFDIRDDGHIYVLTSEPNEVDGFAGRIAEDFVVELDPEGRERKKVSIPQALLRGRQFETLEELQQYQRKTKSLAATDPLHVNSLEILHGGGADDVPELQEGRILISLPTIGRVAVLDFDARQVVWTQKGGFHLQHDPSLLANGNLLLFDNKGLAPERSRVLEIDPATGSAVWSHGAGDSPPFYSECCGRVYRLANGNTLIVDAKSARAFEVTSDHRTVWEFKSPHERQGKVAILTDLLRLPIDESLLEEHSR
jgi:hypothetical protein